MEKLLAAAMVLFGLYLVAGPLPFILFGVAVGAFLIYQIASKAVAEQEADRQRQEREQLRRDQAEAEAQAAYERNQRCLAEQAQSDRARGAMAFVKMPGALVRAEKHLDQAEVEFRERAFSPYWEEVEGALTCLSSVDELAREISYAAEYHDRHSKELACTAQAFPVSIRDVEMVRSAANATRARLADVIRQSRKDFQFSTIYEQRKTNAILIHGFQNLGEAIRGMGDQLAASIDSLGDRIGQLEHGMQSRHEEARADAQELLAATRSLTASSEAAARAAAEQRDRIAGEQSVLATRQLAMLDNLQRHRRPTLTEHGPRLV